MSLLADVVRTLEGNHASHALIGAAAMAVRGVSRSTADVDLLTLDAGVLREDAGGPKDAWDVESLLEIAEDRPRVESVVEDVLPRLPSQARTLWNRLRSG